MGRCGPPTSVRSILAWSPPTNSNRRDHGAAGRLSRSPQRRPAEPTVRLRLADVASSGRPPGRGPGRRPAGPSRTRTSEPGQSGPPRAWPRSCVQVVWFPACELLTWPLQLSKWRSGVGLALIFAGQHPPYWFGPRHAGSASQDSDKRLDPPGRGDRVVPSGLCRDRRNRSRSSPWCPRRSVTGRPACARGVFGASARGAPARRLDRLGGRAELTRSPARLAFRRIRTRWDRLRLGEPGHEWVGPGELPSSLTSPNGDSTSRPLRPSAFLRSTLRIA
jgi:hypothetical protein